MTPSSPIRVYYPLHSRVRRRLVETLKHPPRGVEFVCPTELFQPDHLLSNRKRSTDRLQQLILSVFAFLQIPNIRFVRNIPEGIDLIQVPGQLLANRRPYVVEMDNIASLAFYLLPTLYGRLGKWMIGRFLRARWCQGILVISEACKTGILSVLPDETIARKIQVVYPYVRLNPFPKKPSSKFRVLFVSTNFYLKGGRELIHACERLVDRYPQLEVVMITRAPKEMIDRVQSLPQFRFVDASLSKEELYEHYYSQADVFVLPSYQDSFGLVCLEALAAGLPIIATRMFAIPEMVKEGENGFLIDSPIPYFREDATPNPNWWGKDIAAHVQAMTLPDIEAFLEEKLRMLMDQPELCRRMGAASKAFVETGPFSETTRQERLQRFYQRSVQSSS